MGMSGQDGAAAIKRLAGLRSSSKHDFGILASGSQPTTKVSPEKTSRLSGMKFSSERLPQRLPSQKFSSERSTHSASGAKIKLNRTFLEVHDSDYQPPQRHRANSDPGSEAESRSETMDSTSFWQQEMEKLSEHMNQMWSSKHGAGSAPVSAYNATQAQPQHALFSNRRPSQDAKDPGNTMSWPDGATAAVGTNQNLAGFKPAGAAAMERLESLRSSSQHGSHLAGLKPTGAAAMERLESLRASSKNVGQDLKTRASLEKLSRLPGMKFSSERLSSKNFSSSQSASTRLSGVKFGSSQSASAATNPKIKFGLNRTFLEVHDSESDYKPPQRKRASSDPGTELSSETLSDNFESNMFWQHEMENLSEHMHQIWSNKSSDVSDSASDCMRAQWQQTLFNNRRPSQDLMDPSNTMVWSDGAAATVDAPSDEHLRTISHDQHMAEVRRQLEVRKLEGQYGDRRRKPLSQALAVIAEIPEHVQEFLRETARNLGTDMEERLSDRLSEMRAVIQAEDPENAQDALDKLDAIPDIIMNSFEESFAHANDMVQIKVDGVLSQIGDCDGKDELAFQASTIPEEVARIAETEFATALQASQQRAAAGIDAALRAAPGAAASVPLHLGQCKGSILAAQLRPQLASAQLQTKAQLAVNEAISMAPSAPSAPFPPPVAPSAVAPFPPTFLAPAVVPAAAPVSSPPSQVSLGSVGHPELCPRPCIYFARGVCAHGADCEYCHLDHSKRPSHLDKRNRETLKAARFEEVLVLSLPLMREKVRKLALNPEVLQVLAQLESRLAQTTDFGRIRRTKALQNLGSAMGCLTLRSLLTSLQRPNEQASQEHVELEAYIVAVRNLVMPNASAGNAGGDLPVWGHAL